MMPSSTTLLWRACTQVVLRGGVDSTNRIVTGSTNRHPQPTGGKACCRPKPMYRHLHELDQNTQRERCLPFGRTTMVPPCFPNCILTGLLRTSWLEVGGSVKDQFQSYPVMVSESFRPPHPSNNARDKKSGYVSRRVKLHRCCDTQVFNGKGWNCVLHGGSCVFRRPMPVYNVPGEAQIFFLVWGVVASKMFPVLRHRSAGFMPNGS